jgi:hypothetical protein
VAGAGTAAARDDRPPPSPIVEAPSVVAAPARMLPASQDGRTFRQVGQLHAGGAQVRLHLSNRYGVGRLVDADGCRRIVRMIKQDRQLNGPSGRAVR